MAKPQLRLFSGRLALAWVLLAGLSPIPSTLPAAAAPSLGTGRSVTDLTFLTPSLGWLRIGPGYPGSAGTLFRTGNGGRTWQVVAHEVHATLLAFRSVRTGEALVPVPGGAGACQLPLTAVATQDGGRTWYGPAPVRAEDGPLALAFAGSRPVLVNGSCAGSYATVQTPAAPGHLWREVARLTPPPFQAHRYPYPIAVGLSAEGHVAAIAWQSPGQSRGPLLMVYRRGASVKSWAGTVVPSGPLRGQAMALAFASVQAGIVAMATRNQGRFTLWSTLDGGRVWTPSLNLAGPAQIQLDLVTPQVGYAAVTRWRSGGQVGVPSLFRTTNGGRTWARLALPKQPSGIGQNPGPARTDPGTLRERAGARSFVVSTRSGGRMGQVAPFGN